MVKTFLLHLSAHWGDLIEQIKKICHIHFNGFKAIIFKVLKIVRAEKQYEHPIKEFVATNLA